MFNIEHLKQHKVSPSEAEQVITNDPLYPPENPQTVDGEVRWIVYGQTEQFRCLVVIYPDRGTLLRVVTAYDMDSHQRKDYLRWRKEQIEAEDDEYHAYRVTEENDGG